MKTSEIKKDWLKENILCLEESSLLKQHNDTSTTFSKIL